MGNPTNIRDAGEVGRTSLIEAADEHARTTAQLIAPGTVYGDRVTQVDVRFGKAFRVQRGGRIQASVDVFNVLNSSAILSLNTTYGTNWLSPTQILQGRLVKFGMQFDF